MFKKHELCVLTGKRYVDVQARWIGHEQGEIDPL